MAKMWVEFKVDNKIMGRVIFEDGKITYDALPDRLVEELKHGLYRPNKSTEATGPYFQLPEEDPEWFLQNLEVHYAGGRLHATGVQTG